MSVYPGVARRGPTDDEKAELRSQSDRLVGWGYEEREARQLVWDVFRGGTNAVRACMRIRAEIPDVGDKEIDF